MSTNGAGGRWGRVIGSGQGEEEEKGIAPTALAPCPCGDEAEWYRPDRNEAQSGEKGEGGLGPAVATMDVGNLSLCHACFLSAIPPTAREGWVRVSREDAELAAQKRFGRGLARTNGRNPDNQERRGDPFAPPPLPDDW